MDRQFLSEVTKGYLTNHNVYKDHPKDIDMINKTIYDDLIETIDLIYDVEEDLYEEVKHMKKTDQYRIFEIYLDSSYKSTDFEVVNEGVITGTISYLLGGIWSIAVGLPSPIQIPLIILTLIVIGLNREPITRRTFQFLKIVCNKLDGLGDILKKTRVTKFRYAVLQQNVESCYRKCGITNLKKDIKWSDYFSKGVGDDPGIILLLNDQKKTQCLIHCYVKHEIDKVKLVTKMYFACLRNTQNFDSIKNLSSTKLLAVLSKDSAEHRNLNFAMQSSCAEYFDIISESINTIHDLIKFFYKDKTTQQELIMTLQKDIDNVKQDVMRMNQHQLLQYKQ